VLTLPEGVTGALITEVDEESPARGAGLKRGDLVISIDGHSMEMRPEGNVVILINDDEPGAISKFTSVLAEHSLNIADLTLSRKQRLGLAMVGLNLDEAPTPEVVAQLKSLDCVEAAWAVQLPPLAGM
jgi:predicted metalloprotease with PDZ domain